MLDNIIEIGKLFFSKIAKKTPKKMKNSKSEKSGGEISTGEKRQLDSERDFSREKHEMEMKLLEEQRAKEKSKLKPIVLKKQDLKDER